MTTAIVALLIGAVVVALLVRYIRLDVLGVVSLLAAGLWVSRSGVVGAITARYTPAMAVAWVLIALGLGLLAGIWVVRHVAWPGTFPWRMQRALVDVGLVRKVREGRDEAPRLHRKRRSGHVWTLSYRLPAGVTVSAVRAKQEALEQLLNCGVQVSFHRGRLVMHVGRAQVPDAYELDDELLRAPRPGELGVHLGRGHYGDLDYDLTTWPHALIAGTTGSGKSSFVLALLAQLILRYTPDQLQIVVVDLKAGQSMGILSGLPHLWAPIAVNHADAAAVLADLEVEQTKRHQQTAARNVDSLGEWNARYPDEALPHLLLLVDEWADLLPKEAKGRERDVRQACWDAASAITRMGRSAGVFAWLCTQRPDANVVDGQIRSNCMFRVAFSCETWGSVVVLGPGNTAAAELPRQPTGLPVPGAGIVQWSTFETRFQSAYVTREGIEAAVREAKRLYGTGLGLSAGAGLAAPPAVKESA